MATVLQACQIHMLTLFFGSSGMNVYAACFLIPLVVAAYVIAGGLRSTFIADYVHTVVLFIAIFVFGFSVYATSDLVGSPSRLYDLLEQASKTMPIPGNVDESYLAFRSVDGLVFAIDLFAAGFSTVWLDQAYWQRAIASKPETSVRAYILGGIAWYGIPFGTILMGGPLGVRHVLTFLPIALQVLPLQWALAARLSQATRDFRHTHIPCRPRRMQLAFPPRLRRSHFLVKAELS